VAARLLLVEVEKGLRDELWRITTWSLVDELNDPNEYRKELDRRSHAINDIVHRVIKKYSGPCARSQELSRRVRG
jgi:hypothetical protein